MISDKERKRIRQERKRKRKERDRIEKDKRRRFTRKKTTGEVAFRLDQGYSQLPPDQRKRLINTVDRGQRIGGRIREGLRKSSDEGKRKIRKRVRDRFSGGFSELLGFNIRKKPREKS